MHQRAVRVPTAGRDRSGAWLLLSLVAAAAGLHFGAGCARRTEGVRAAGAARPYTSAAWEFDGAPGRRLLSEHYEIYTTVRDDRLVATFPELMESAYEWYQRLVPPANEARGRMPIYLFATRAQWETFTRRFAGPRAASFLRIQNGGYSERGVTAIVYVSHQTTFPLMAHEGLHQYLYCRVTPWAPAWLNEGLAVLCEGQHWEGTRLRAFDPWHAPARRNAVAEAALRNELFPLRELLETHAGRVVRLPSRLVATYYGQLWAWMLFLREGQGGIYADRLDHLLANLASMRPGQFGGSSGAPGRRAPRSAGEAVFREYISDELDAVDREFTLFVRQRIVAAQR